MSIDYGMGKTNVDIANGIRYGVINQNEVLQAWCDESEPYYPCGECEVPEDERDMCMCEPSSFYVDDGEYQAESNSYGDIFITKSPYYTLCGYCSLCAPGAGYLMARTEDCMAYCFGHDWFEDGKAPYPVYRVDNNELVE